MASYNIFQVQDTTFGLTTCEMCNSTDIKQEPTGYVCGNCGLVLSGLVLRHDRPYHDQKVQHAPLGKTQMGFYKERQVLPRSDRMAALSKLDQERPLQERLKNKARCEIHRILSAMDLPLTESNALQKMFWKLYTQLQPGTKYRSVEKLVPITLYLYFKLECKVFSQRELLEVAKISEKELNSFKLQLRNFVPHYETRNRKELILKMIIAICEEYDLGMPFYSATRKILFKFWEILKSTKDSVIAAVCCSIMQLCSGSNITVSRICDHFGIRMSTVHRQVERKIFESLRIEGFESLVRSAGLLRELMVKMEIIEPEEEVQPISVIRIKVGNVPSVLNSIHKTDLYFYAIKTTSGEFLVMDPEYAFGNEEIMTAPPKGEQNEEDCIVQAIKFDCATGPPE